jgi:hypothetical protein
MKFNPFFIASIPFTTIIKQPIFQISKMAAVNATIPLTTVTSMFQEIKAMPYFRNYAAAGGAVHNIANHETAVADVLARNGLVAWNPDNQFRKAHPRWTDMIHEWIDRPETAADMPLNSFMSQPCGTNGNPDFIIKFGENQVIGVECKSSNETCPMYNSGSIKQNYIYLFTSKRTNATTIFVGRDVMSLEQQRIMDELEAKHRELDKEYNARLRAIDIHHRGVSYYTRPMIQQSGGAEYTNYFTHAERGQCEQNVYSFIDSIIENNYGKTEME